MSKEGTIGTFYLHNRAQFVLSKGHYFRFAVFHDGVIVGEDAENPNWPKRETIMYMYRSKSHSIQLNVLLPTHEARVFYKALHEEYKFEVRRDFHANTERNTEGVHSNV